MLNSATPNVALRSAICEEERVGEVSPKLIDLSDFSHTSTLPAAPHWGAVRVREGGRETGVGGPRWLLYLQNATGNGEPHLFRVDYHHPQNPPVDLTPFPSMLGVFTVDCLYSMPGTVLVMMEDQSKFRDHLLIDVATGEVTSQLPAALTKPRKLAVESGEVSDRTGRDRWPGIRKP